MKPTLFFRFQAYNALWKKNNTPFDYKSILTHGSQLTEEDIEYLRPFAEEVIEEGRAYKEWLDTLSPEDKKIQLEEDEIQHRENAVRFIMDTSFGGP